MLNPFLKLKDLAKKMIDAEQYEKAKSELKAIYQAKPSNGKAAFLLGTIYLKQNAQDSAKLFFDKGVSALEFSKLNQIGLGQIDLDNNKIAEAKTKFDLVLKDTKKKEIIETYKSVKSQVKDAIKELKKDFDL